jgi:hypothetical protein
MKKTCFAIRGTAIVLGVALAFSFRPSQGCLGTPQYYYNGSAYLPAGTLGKDYMCTSGSGTCTYYGGNGTYLPCQSGVFLPFHAAAKKKKGSD